MKMYRALSIAAATFAFAIVVAPAHAAPTLFFGEDVAVADGSQSSTPNSRSARASFEALYGGNVLVEDFESYAVGDVLPAVPPFGIPTASFTNGTATVLAGFDQAGAVTSSPLATSGSNTYGDDEDWLTVGAFTSQDGTIGGVEVNGFGLFGIGIDAPVTITVSFSDGSTSDFDLGNTLSRNAIFFWAIHDDERTITGVTGAMPLNIGSGFYLMDDLAIGLAPVQTPAPGAIALFGIGALILAARRRSKADMR